MGIYKAHWDLIIQGGEYVGKVYRCTGCGKWSHAKKKPTKHERFIREDQPRPLKSIVLGKTNTEYGFEGEVISEGGWTVECGPFETLHIVSEKEY